MHLLRKTEVSKEFVKWGAKNRKIIDKDFYGFFYHISKYRMHAPFKSSGGIAQSKGHSSLGGHSKWASKSCVFFIC